MRVQKKDSDRERRILIGMIVDEIVLGRIGSKWKGRMFRSRWANLVASWCLNYYEKYKEAPLQQIESLFETWADIAKDKSVVSLVGKFLDSLSEEYEDLKTESNSDYIIDIAGQYFNQVQIEKLLEEVQSDIDSGNTKKAHHCLSSYNQIEMGVGEGIDILQDEEAIKEAFAGKGESLIEYPGALGEFFKGAFERDAFIALMGPEKRGKSFWLMDIAFRAMLQRKKVAFFEAGDMSQNQIMRRLMTRVSKRPLKPCTVIYPTAIKRGEGYKTKIRVKEKIFHKKLSWRRAMKACRLLMYKKVRSKDTYFKLSCHFNTTLTIRGINGILQDWEREGWVPDVIIIDYADILDMSHSSLEGRDLINETWKQMRALSQKYHCLLVTATESDSISYGKEIITMSNFSEDKRKLSHVTGMVGLNVTPVEKEMGVMRLNWIVLRESPYSDKKCVYVAGCLAIANPAIRSTF